MLKCKCNKPPEYKFSDKDKLHWYYCTPCKLKASGKTKEEAAENFKKLIDNQPTPATIELLPVPKSKNEFIEIVNDNRSMIISSNAPRFMGQSEVGTMYERNIKYILQADLKKVWDTPEGRESVSDAFIESIRYFSILGETGYIIPFGMVADFIPEKTCFITTLTAGKKPPISEIYIDAIHENDIREPIVRDENGELFFKIKSIGMPRGEIIGVVVRVKMVDTGKIIGEVYDEPRLMDKAKLHSQAYKYYLKDMQAFKEAQSEGKDYIEKWNRKFYEYDITNPYDNADKPEMLKKLAAKSFLWPFVKERNARAIADELGTIIEVDTSTPEKILDRSLEAVKQDIQDAEFTVDEPEKPQEPEQEKPAKKGKDTEENGKLFGEGL